MPNPRHFLSEVIGIRGVDVSKNNGSVNFKTLKRLGYDFAIIRDGFGWGAPGQKDAKLDQHYQNAKAAGMQTGFYHYVYSLDANGAKQEALEAIDHIKGKDVDLFVACDIEEFLHTTLSDKILTDMVIAFTDQVRNAGYKPAVYSFASLLNSLQWDRIPDDVLVWAAHWGVDSPEVNHKVDCWQHDVIGVKPEASIKGTLPGAGGDIDVNIMTDAQPETDSDWKAKYQQLAAEIVDIADRCREVMGIE